MVKPISTLNVELDVGTTSQGNERIPVTRPIELEYASVQ